MKKHFGLRIKELRESAGESKTALARSIKSSKVVVGQWEAGDIQTISGEFLLALADHYNVSPFYILRGRGSASTPAHSNPNIELFLTVLQAVDESLISERIAINSARKVEIIRTLYDYYHSRGEHPRDKMQVIDLMKFRLSFK